jgi:hypothetical protein
MREQGITLMFKGLYHRSSYTENLWFLPPIEMVEREDLLKWPLNPNGFIIHGGIGIRLRVKP